MDVALEVSVGRGAISGSAGAIQVINAKMRVNVIPLVCVNIREHAILGK